MNRWGSENDEEERIRGEERIKRGVGNTGEEGELKKDEERE